MSVAVVFIVYVFNFRAVAKKVHGTIQKIKKEGKMSECLLNALLNCKTFEELEHVVRSFVMPEHLWRGVFSSLRKTKP